jgi:hypothetical protein
LVFFFRFASLICKHIVKQIIGEEMLFINQ